MFIRQALIDFFTVANESKELTFENLVTPSPTAYFRPPHIEPAVASPHQPASPANNFNLQSTAPFGQSNPLSPQPPAAHYQPPPQQQWQPTYRPPTMQINTFTPTIGEPPIHQITSSVAARRSPLDMGQLQNYNRAASGWGQSKDFYRPVTFNKPKVVLAYSDF